MILFSLLRVKAVLHKDNLFPGSCIGKFRLKLLIPGCILGFFEGGVYGNNDFDREISPVSQRKT